MQMSQQENAGCVRRTLPEPRVLDSETFTDFLLRLLNFSVNLIRREIDEARRDIRKQCFKLQLFVDF